MKPIEQIEVDQLKEVCKALNEHLYTPIQVIDVSVPDLVKSFTEAIENMSEDEQQKLPDQIADFYNDLYEDEAAEPGAEPKQEEKEEPEGTEPDGEKKEGEGEENKEATGDEKKEEKGSKNKKKKAAPAAKKEKKDKPKKEKKPKKEEKEKKPPAEKEYDEFGFIKGSKNSMFAAAIKEKPMKMSEVRNLQWNEGRNTYYDAFKKLEGDGKGVRTTEGVMSIKS